MLSNPFIALDREPIIYFIKLWSTTANHQTMQNVFPEIKSTERL